MIDDDSFHLRIWAYLFSFIYPESPIEMFLIFKVDLAASSLK